MSLSKTSGKQALSKSSGAVHVARSLKAKPSGEHFYGVTANKPYNPKTRNPAARPEAFNAANLIVLTVNPELDKGASAEKLNAKAESAKQMFANYRSKK